MDEARLTALLTEHGITVISDKPVEDLLKFDNNAAVQVAEEAFTAGYVACVKHIVEDPTERYWQAASQEAWSNFEPSEAIKELVG